MVMGFNTLGLFLNGFEIICCDPTFPLNSRIANPIFIFSRLSVVPYNPISFKMKQYFLSTILIFLLAVITHATTFAQEWVSLIPTQTSLLKEVQEPKDTNEIRPQSNVETFSWHDPITKLPQDLYKFGGEIVNPKNIPTVAGLAVLTGALMSIDHRTSAPLYSDYKSSSNVKNISNKISWLGGGEFHLIVASVFGSAGLILKNDRAVRTALQIVEAELSCGLTVQLLKRVSGRESPQSASTPRGTFRPFPNWSEYSHHETRFYSFPSGHLSTSMAVLTVIADNYPESTWIKPIGYTALGVIGVALATRGWHWFSDYPLALAIGYTYGKIISSRNQLLTIERNNKSKLSLMPIYLNGPALSLNYSF